MEQKHITPPITKFILTYFDETSNKSKDVDITDDVTSWHGMETILERDGTTGVMPVVSLPMELVRNAKNIVKDLFRRNGLFAKAKLTVYKRDNWDLKFYKRMASFELQFHTYAEHNNTVEIELSSIELNDYIGANFDTKWDIPVADVCEVNIWSYSAIPLVNNATLNTASFTTKENPGMLIRIPISLSNASMVPDSKEHDIKSQSLGYDTNDYIFKADGKQDNVKIYCNLFEQFYCKIQSGKYVTRAIATTYIAKISSNGSKEIIYSDISDGRIDNLNREVNFRIGRINIIKSVNMNSNDRIVIYSEVKFEDSYSGAWESFQSIRAVVSSTYTEIKIEYLAGRPYNSDINVIKPKVLLQKFINLITNSNDYSCDIDWGDIDYEPMLVAAESIRGFTLSSTGGSSVATIHNSIGDFMKWMRFMGYEYEYDEATKQLKYEPRDNFFQKNNVVLSLSEKECADLIIKADSEYAYTAISIGYEKQEYNQGNGKYEVNGTYDYSTGFNIADSNSLELISPYRGDAIGIEILTWERDNTKDTKSDDDVFCVAMEKNNGGNFKEYRNLEIVVESDYYNTFKLFNAPLNPHFIAKRNDNLIGINCRKMTFAGTTSYRNASIEGEEIFSNIDISIDRRLFLPLRYNFASGNHIPLPEGADRRGVIAFKYHGKKYYGFIVDIRKNWQFETETTWELLATEIEEG